MSWLPDWLTGHDAENQARGAAASAERTRIRDAELAANKWNYTPAQVDQIHHNYANDHAGDQEWAEADIEAGFEEGWVEGRENISTTISGTINKIVMDPVRAILGGIPLWLWLVAGLGVFAYFGGLGWAKKKLL